MYRSYIDLLFIRNRVNVRLTEEVGKVLATFEDYEYAKFNGDFEEVDALRNILNSLDTTISLVEKVL